MTENTEHNNIPETIVSTKKPISLWKKWLLWSFSTFFILLITAYLFIAYNRWVQQKIIQTIDNQINTVDFEIAEIEINFWKNKIYFKEVAIEYFKNNTKVIDKIPQITIEGVHWYHWFFNDSLC